MQQSDNDIVNHNDNNNNINNDNDNDNDNNNDNDIENNNVSDKENDNDSNKDNDDDVIVEWYSDFVIVLTIHNSSQKPSQSDNMYIVCKQISQPLWCFQISQAIEF